MNTVKSPEPVSLEKIFSLLYGIFNLKASRNNLSKLRLVKDIEFHLTLASLSGGGTGSLILQHVFDLLYLKYRAYLLMLRSGDEGHKMIFDCVGST